MRGHFKNFHVSLKDFVYLNCFTFLLQTIESFKMQALNDFYMNVVLQGEVETKSIIYFPQRIFNIRWVDLLKFSPVESKYVGISSFCAQLLKPKKIRQGSCNKTAYKIIVSWIGLNNPLLWEVKGGSLIFFLVSLSMALHKHVLFVSISVWSLFSQSASSSTRLSVCWSVR